MTWALKRQLLYMGILAIFLIGTGYLVLAPYFNKIPTCTDNVKNGDEKGIDCGGSCSKACSFEVDQISILWSRSFEVVPGRYNAIAYLENHNKTSAIKKIKYKFRFSDKDNLYIGKREGETFIPPGMKFAIFEPGIDVGNSVPVYTTFEFSEMPVWNNVSTDVLGQLKISVHDIRLDNEKANPILTATIKNDSLFTVPELGIIALLYDEKGNTLSVSRTYIEELSGAQTKNVSFTWPQPFKGNVIAKEIIPMYNIFQVKLK